MTIRTDAINIYVKAYEKLCLMNGYNLKTYSLGGNSVGIGFESDGIKFVFAKATDNMLTQCPFANNELKSICIPLQPSVLNSAEIMNLDVIQVFANYMNGPLAEAVLHEIVHLLDLDTSEYDCNINDKAIYYNNVHERLAYSAELYTVIEQKLDKKALPYFIKLLDNKESILKYVKRELRNHANLNTYIDFVKNLTKENYSWFKEYCLNEYQACK